MSILLELGTCHTTHLDTRCQKDEGKPDPQASKLDKARGRPEAPEGPSPRACGIQSMSTSTGCLKRRFLAEHQSKPEENTEPGRRPRHSRTCTHTDLGSRVVPAKCPQHQQTNTTRTLAQHIGHLEHQLEHDSGAAICTSGAFDICTSGAFSSGALNTCTSGAVSTCTSRAF